jgi:hypothetical protein
MRLAYSWGAARAVSATQDEPLSPVPGSLPSFPGMEAVIKLKGGFLEAPQRRRKQTGTGK